MFKLRFWRKNEPYPLGLTIPSGYRLHTPVMPKGSSYHMGQCHEHGWPMPCNHPVHKVKEG